MILSDEVEYFGYCLPESGQLLSYTPRWGLDIFTMRHDHFVSLRIPIICACCHHHIEGLWLKRVLAAEHSFLFSPLWVFLVESSEAE